MRSRYFSQPVHFNLDELFERNYRIVLYQLSFANAYRASKKQLTDPQLRRLTREVVERAFAWEAYQSFTDAGKINKRLGDAGLGILGLYVVASLGVAPSFSDILVRLFLGCMTAKAAFGAMTHTESESVVKRQYAVPVAAFSRRRLQSYRYLFSQEVPSRRRFHQVAQGDEQTYRAADAYLNNLGPKEAKRLLRTRWWLPHYAP
jgi:uncharacterized membrane protein